MVSSLINSFLALSTRYTHDGHDKSPGLDLKILDPTGHTIYFISMCVTITNVAENEIGIYKYF